MRHADTALKDDALLLIVQQELARRCKNSKTRWRKATPTEVVLRMLLLKHVRDWSYEELSREVRSIWFIASSPESAVKRFRMIRRWGTLTAR
jgi:IS5 family transposase